MSQEAVQNLIGRAVMDKAFRELLFSDPNKALEGYDLSEEEVKALEELEAEEFEAISGELEEELPDWEIKVGPREAVDLPAFLKQAL